MWTNGRFRLESRWLCAFLIGFTGFTMASPLTAQIRERHNFYGMHNLMDGGAPIPEGMNWTRHMVGEGGYVFDWVRGDYGQWVVDAMDRGLIPCLRVQDCNGGCDPSDSHPEIVATVIREHLERYRPQYVNRLVYFQIWNEPGDPRDRVTPERYADHLVAAYAGVKRADRYGVFRVMTPGQNGPDFWERAIRHNPGVCQAFDVWATHPYPESYPPHYNHHDGVPFINQVKTIDSYLLDLDAVARTCDEVGSPRRGFPVMITETAYGDHLGIAYEGYPKTTRGEPCLAGGPCDYKMAAEYNVAAFTRFWHQWPEVLAVHPFILNNWSWDHFAFVSKTSGSRSDLPVPPWCPPEDRQAATPWPAGYSEGAQRCGLPTAPYPQYQALLQLPKPPSGGLEPYRGPTGSIVGAVRRADTGEPVKYATVFTDGRELGGPSLFDGRYAVRDVPVGTYTLSVEKVGYRSASTTVSVREGEEAVVDFDLVYEGKVSRGIYFQNQGTCGGCDLYASYLGQSFRTPADVGFIQFVAAMPNVGNVLMKFTILDGGPSGPPVGEPVTAYLEWGGEMIGAEFPGDGVAVEPDHTYFLKVERADGQGVYLYATDADPYPEGMAYTGETPHPGWDLFATIRGATQAVASATGSVVGRVEDEAHLGLAGATVTASPSGRSTRSGADGRYSLSGLTPGTTTVSVFLDGYLPQSRSVQVVEQSSVDVSFTLVRDTSTGAIEGDVHSTSGTPLEGVRLEALPGGHVTSTDAGGHYRLSGLPTGDYTLTASLDGYEPDQLPGVRVQSGSTTREDFTLAPLVQPPPPSTLIANGDFSRGLEGWSVWVERGPLTPQVGADGRLHLEATGHNGGVYQTFTTGGAGRELRVEGFWASAPTMPGAQWAEVLVINGPGKPLNGTDLNEGSPDVILLFKNDTWTLPSGWSGKLSEASVRAVGSFIARGDVATLVLKSGNLSGVASGTVFDDIQVTGGDLPPPPSNHPPTAVAAAQPAAGVAPLLVQFDGSASSDPDGDPLRFEWDVGDGSPPLADMAPSHQFVASGSFDVRLSVDDGRGGVATAHLAISVGAPTTPTSLVVNGDFSQGLSGWSVWTERGALSPTVGADGRARLTGTSINGGLYQSFNTGGPGTEITVEGFWASEPTVASAQWAEVLVIDSDRRPVEGQDLNADQNDVVLLYKNDTWTSPGGWSGSFGTTAPVHNLGSFIASGDVATLVVKTGNLPGVSSGLAVDDIEVRSAGSNPPPPPPPTPHDPIAVASATPLFGPAPLTVSFDASGSTDPDGDALTYAWDFGDGGGSAGVSVSHLFDRAGSYMVTLTVRDASGVEDTDQVRIDVSSTPDPGGGSLVTNGRFEEGFSAGVGRGWSSWSAAGTGYWKSSSRLGRIGAGVYSSGGSPLLDTIVRLHPKIVLLFDQALGMAPAVRQALPDALLIGRLYIDHLVGQYLSDPERWGRYHAEECYRVHVEKGAVIDAWQGLNEPFMNTVEEARKVARFEKAFSDHLHELGLKSVVLNLAVGNPGDMDIMLLPEVVDALSEADYVGYHAYGGDVDQLMVGPQSPWFAHRWRFYADMYRQRGYRMPPVIYTEATTFNGWKGRFAPWEIRDDLIAFEAESRNDTWSLGLAIFTFGMSSPDWVGWEVSSEPVIYEGAGDYNWEHPADAFSGVASQQIGSDGGGFRGGIVQRVAVQAGSSYRFATSMKYTAAAPGALVGYRVGVDPTGQTSDGAASTILWSNDLVAAESRETDTWYTSSDVFTANGSWVSIWIEAASLSLDAFGLWVDQVSVQPLDGSLPPP